jgi:hypothetical protein
MKNTPTLRQCKCARHVATRIIDAKAASRNTRGLKFHPGRSSWGAQWEDPSSYVVELLSPTKFPSGTTVPLPSGGANTHTAILSPHTRAIAFALTKYSKLKHPAANTAGSAPMLAYTYVYIDLAAGICPANSAKQKPDRRAGTTLRMRSQQSAKLGPAYVNVSRPHSRKKPVPSVPPTPTSTRSYSIG